MYSLAFIDLVILGYMMMGFPAGLVVQNPPAMQETWVQSLGWQDPLEEGMPTHSSIHAWGIPCMGEPRGLLHRVTKRSLMVCGPCVHTKLLYS